MFLSLTVRTDLAGLPSHEGSGLKWLGQVFDLLWRGSPLA